MTVEITPLGVQCNLDHPYSYQTPMAYLKDFSLDSFEDDHHEILPPLLIEDEDGDAESEHGDSDDSDDDSEPLNEPVESPPPAVMATSVGRRWVMLTDYHGDHATIMSLDDDEERRSITTAQVENQGPVGLRRMILEETKENTHYRETGEFTPITPELHQALVTAYHGRTNWNFDWPNLPVETDLSAEASLREKLCAMMADHPMPFEILGLQRRFLMYYSDGDWRTQQNYIALAPHPTAYPYTTKGNLRKDARGTLGKWGIEDKIAGKAPPQMGVPLLYVGPAWAVRFKLDEQIPLFQHCIMYVTDEGQFLCSDWCQRHDFSTYGNGINLQLGIYSFDAWVMGPCLKMAMDKQVFKPRTVKVERMAVREILRNGGKKAVDRRLEQTLKATVIPSLLPEVVQTHLAKSPKMSPADRVAAIVLQLKMAFNQGDGKAAVGAYGWVYCGDLIGKPIGVTSPIDGNNYARARVLAPCGETSGMCFRVPTTEGATHVHGNASKVSGKHFQFDDAGTKSDVEQVLERLMAPKGTSVAGPITAETMELVDEVFQAQQKGRSQRFVCNEKHWIAKRRKGYVEIVAKGLPPHCVVKKANGHVYLIDPSTMDTSLLLDESVRAAALFFFEMKDFEVVPFETLQAEADLADAQRKAEALRVPSFLSGASGSMGIDSSGFKLEHQGVPKLGFTGGYPDSMLESPSLKLIFHDYKSAKTGDDF